MERKSTLLSTEIIESIIQRSVKDGGATYDASERQFVEKRDQWIFPRWPDLTTIVSETRLKPALMEFVASHSDKLRDKVYLGVWRRGDEYYIDCNTYTDNLKDAQVLAKTYSQASQRSIVSAYNPAKGTAHYF